MAQRSEDIHLDAEQELRVEVGYEDTCKLTLIDGKAEVFGSELAKGQACDLTGRSIAIYTWHGATLNLTGQWSVQYTSSETPMRSYINTHAALEQLRETARHNSSRGPKVLIVGPSGTGKTALSKILTNYAVRQGGQPLLIDLDPREVGLIRKSHPSKHVFRTT
eukprot:TRINITY_DN10925_c0_g1_i1.p1 TRINITY_DN10925_c0_g1~~TRINITY_DN10925_c0_g1_i1.p1  ORF type:complete len:164 (+),score=12.26 TRINITY_DN10925_c0_g1_i1:2-493(+)